MIDLDITQTNRAIDRLLERTENPRHAYLLQAFHRHRYLEIAGRYEEIAEDEQLAVGDHHVCSDAFAYQQRPGLALVAQGHLVDDLGAHYLLRLRQLMMWEYDDRCRLIGENVWEVEPGSAEVIKLDPTDVLTADRTGELLDPHIRELPPFDETAMGSLRKRLASLSLAEAAAARGRSCVFRSPCVAPKARSAHEGLRYRLSQVPAPGVRTARCRAFFRSTSRP